MQLLTRIKNALRPNRFWQVSNNGFASLDRLYGATKPFDQHHAVSRLSSWVYAAANLNAQAVASTPLRLYVRRRIGRKLFNSQPVSHQRKRYLLGDTDAATRPSNAVCNKLASWGDDFEVVNELHPALRLMQTVNPFFNGFELTVLRMLYLQLTGNCYVLSIRDDALQTPQQLWVMPSQWTCIIPGKQQFIDGYEYGRSVGDKIRFDTDEVIHFKLPNVSDLYYGKGPLEAVWSALGLHEAKRQMDLARFENHARPDYLLVVKQGASAEALDRFEKQIDQKLRGVNNSGRFITITGDVESVPLNLPPDVIGDPDRVVEEIAAGFGVPVAKLLTNHPNRASAETSNLAWLRDTIHPYCRLDEEKLNEQYLPMFDVAEDAVLAYDNPVPEEKQYQLRRRTSLVAAGILTVDEARAEEGLPPLESNRS